MLAVVVSVVGGAWWAAGPRGAVDEGVISAHAVSTPDSSVPAPSNESAGPLQVSNALGAPIPGDTTRQDVPRAVEDWIDRALPVAGRLSATVDGVAGTVRIERVGDATVAVSVQGMALPAGHQEARLVLARQAPPRADGVAHATGTAVFSADGGDASLVVDPSALQADIRWAALVDDASGQVLGTAWLVPVD